MCVSMPMVIMPMIVVRCVVMGGVIMRRRIMVVPVRFHIMIMRPSSLWCVVMQVAICEGGSRLSRDRRHGGL